MAGGRGPKRRGDGYERELAAYINQKLFEGKNVVTRAPLSGGGRGFQFSAGGGADLTGLPDVWVEAKRTEAFSPYQAMKQAEAGIASKRAREFPMVITRRNRLTTGESLAVVRLDVMLDLLAAYYKQTGVKVIEAPLEEEQADLGI